MFAETLPISTRYNFIRNTAKLKPRTLFMIKHYFYTAVIFLSLFAAACETASSSDKNVETTGNVSANTADSTTNYDKPRTTGTLKDDAIKESSGVAASRTNPGAFWTHNDSGDGAFLYAFDETGKKLGVWQVEGAQNIDWEDIAAYTDKKTGVNYLLIGDTGDNARRRSDITIYRIAEPKIAVSDAKSSKKAPIKTAVADALTLKYPEGKFDAETLIINQTSGDLYILTKDMTEKSFVYKAAAPFSGGKTSEALKKVAEIAVPSILQGFITGGDASPDGGRVVICDYFAAYEYVLPPNAKDFDEVWKATPAKIDLGARDQGEAVAYTIDGKALIATSEKSKSPVTFVRRK